MKRANAQLENIPTQHIHCRREETEKKNPSKMSIEMQIKCAAFSQLAKHNIKMQYIPVGTGENVSANVKEYFDDYTHEENGGI